MTKRKKQRVDKILVHMGIGTRKEVKKLVKSGRVMVNQEQISDPGLHIDPQLDQIMVDGEPLHYREYIYLMLNKPAGIISATEDRFAKVVVDLLSPEFQHFAPFPVGRLDKDTEGLLLLTNDGALAHQLLSPKKLVPKTYYAKIAGKVTEAEVELFHQGVTLEDGYKTMPGQLKILTAGDRQSEIELTIYEGKFHQVKRMFAAVGKKVLYLKRIAMGPLHLDPSLALGEYRELTSEEVQLLKK